MKILKAVGYNAGDRTYLAQDRYQWWAYIGIRVVMNTWVR